jgi:hypothetical protein
MKPFLFLITIASILTFCSKDDAEDISFNEKVDSLLINTKWVIIENIAIDSLKKVTDLTADKPEFQKDDYLLFNRDSTYELNDNTILRSDTASLIIDAGKWQLSPDKKMIMRESTVFGSTYPAATIKEISTNTLYLETFSEADKSTVSTRYQKID